MLTRVRAVRGARAARRRRYLADADRAPRVEAPAWGFSGAGSPSPTLRLRLLAKFGAGAGTRRHGWAASAEPGKRFRDSGAPLTPAPSLVRRRRIRLSPIGVQRGQHPLATSPSSLEPRAAAAPRRGSAPSFGGEEGRRRRRGPAAPLARQEAAPGGRRFAPQAGERAVLPGALPARPEWASGPRRRRIPEPCPRSPGSLLLPLGSLLCPPAPPLPAPFSPHPAPTPARRATWEPLAKLAMLGLRARWASGAGGRGAGGGAEGEGTRPRGGALSRTLRWAFVPGAAPPTARPRGLAGDRLDSHPSGRGCLSWAEEMKREPAWRSW